MAGVSESPERINCLAVGPIYDLQKGSASKAMRPKQGVDVP